MTLKFGGFYGRALNELNGLSDEVRDGPLLDRILELLEAPWDSMPERRGETFMRQAYFGNTSQGLLTFYIVEDKEILCITDIVWLG